MRWTYLEERQVRIESENRGMGNW